MSQMEELDKKLLVETYHSMREEHLSLMQGVVPQIEIDRILREKFSLEELDVIDQKLDENVLPVIWENSLDEVETDSTNWIVENYIPKNSIVIIGGKPASFKTFGALHLAVSIATGKPLFGNLPTEKSSVLYIDEENGLVGLKDKVKMVKSGMGINESINIAFLSVEGFKLDAVLWRRKLEKFLSEYNPSIIIVDTFRRIISIDENEATKMNEIFTRHVRPIMEKYNVAWVFLHHLRKDNRNRLSDPMDELRGSSEIANIADVILLFERKGSSGFTLRQIKCRRSLEQPPQSIGLNWSEDAITFEMRGIDQGALDAIERCSRAIVEWLTSNNAEEFETQEVKDVLSQEFSNPTITRALSHLTTQGSIERTSRGHYRRIDES